MKIAIVHYHLKPGGVTRVIENAVNALEPFGHNVVVLAGEPYEGGAMLKTVVSPGLRYTQPNEKPDAGALAHSLKFAARGMVGGEPDVWHIHNHSLGKNSAMAEAACKLAQNSGSVLLQMHDFAEDGRPANYENLTRLTSIRNTLYPQAPHIHYAALNARDQSFLAASGVPADRLHLLPNPVTGAPERAENPSKPKGLDCDHLFLYPTRAIRRKNIGELILFAALARQGELFAATLAPDNPTARPVYDRWVEFAKERFLPVEFAVGQRFDISFADLMGAADSIISTSVAEGFGLAFLEPWLFGKPLVGRNIPDITADFAKRGVGLDYLYERVNLPVEWVGESALREKLFTSLKKYYEAYGKPLPAEAVQVAFDSIVVDGQVDFGRLSEDLQERVIERVLDNPDEARKRVIPSSPRVEVSAEKIAAMQETILHEYSLKAYGQKLNGIYEQLASAPRTELSALAPDEVLAQFLDPARFNFLRT